MIPYTSALEAAFAPFPRNYGVWSLPMFPLQSML